LRNVRQELGHYVEHIAVNICMQAIMQRVLHKFIEKLSFVWNSGRQGSMQQVDLEIHFTLAGKGIIQES
jgi:hypothetical protein